MKLIDNGESGTLGKSELSVTIASQTWDFPLNTNMRSEIDEIKKGGQGDE